MVSSTSGLSPPTFLTCFLHWPQAPESPLFHWPLLTIYRWFLLIFPTLGYTQAQLLDLSSICPGFLDDHIQSLKYYPCDQDAHICITCLDPTPEFQTQFSTSLLDKLHLELKVASGLRQ